MDIGLWSSLVTPKSFAGVGTVAFDTQSQNDKGCPVEEEEQRLSVSRLGVYHPSSVFLAGLEETALFSSTSRAS